MRWFKWSGLIVLALMFAACEHGDGIVDGGNGDENGGIEPTLESIQANIFNVSCALSNCHAGSGAAAGLDLSAGNSRAELVAVRSTELPDFNRVTPGNADDSYLVMKLEGDSRIVGARMPFNRSALTSTQIDAIRAWIDGGAE